MRTGTLNYVAGVELHKPSTWSTRKQKSCRILYLNIKALLLPLKFRKQSVPTQSGGAEKPNNTKEIANEYYLDTGENEQFRSRLHLTWTNFPNIEKYKSFKAFTLGWNQNKEVTYLLVISVMGTSASGEQKEAKKHVKMMFKCGGKPCAWCGW